MNISNNGSNIPSFAEDDEFQKAVIDAPAAYINNNASIISVANKDITSASPSISYWRLLVSYPKYRYFLISYIVTQLGEWLTYVASLSILELAATSAGRMNVESSSNVSPVESFAPGASTKQQQQHHFLISILVVCRLIPNTLSSFVGGILADTRDRKLIMFRLDICGGCVAIVYYIMAIRTLHSRSDEDQPSTLVSTTSVIILLLCTIAQSTISGLYQPSRSSIVPMLVGDDQRDNIEKANEITSIIWSLSAAVGSSLGGFIVDHFGVAICFATDTCMYFTSAIILALFVTGNYDVMSTSLTTKSVTTNHSSKVTSTTNDTGSSDNVQGHADNKKTTTAESRNRKSTSKKLLSHSNSGSKNHSGIRGLLQEVRFFITTHDSAPYLLIKGCGALLFGASDVINVTFAQNPETGDLDPQRLGYLFSAIGIGCLLGPIVMPPRRCYLSACIGSYYVIALGYGCMAWSKSFGWKCFWTVVRASGSAVLWVDSSILLQTTTPATLLGRISSIDFAIALLCEAASAMFAGFGQDYGMSAQQISFVLSGVGFFWGVIWTLATILHRQRRQKQSTSDPSSVELEPLKLNP